MTRHRWISAVSQFYHELTTVNRDNLGRASPVVRYTLMGLVSLLMMVGGWLLLISPSIDRLASLHRIEKNLIDEYHRTSAEAAALDGVMQAQLNQNNQLEIALARLPKSAAITTITTKLSQTASTAGVTLISSRVQPMQRQTHFTERPIRVQAKGSYHQLGAWLHSLTLRYAGSDYLLTLDDYSMTVDGSNQLLIEMTLKTYQANPVLISGSASQVQGVISGVPQ